jgi:hypothetical protein
MIQTKTKKSAPLKGRPMGGKIGEFQDMIDKAKRGDRQAEADLKLERAKLKTFGEGPGAGASGAMPQPKKKMGGKVMKKAKSGGSFGMLSVKAGIDKNPNPTAADRIAGATKGKAKMGKSVKKAQMGASVKSAPMMMKKGGMMKKCKSGCK